MVAEPFETKYQERVGNFKFDRSQTNSVNKIFKVSNK